MLPESLVDEENRCLLAVLKAFGAARGEPWLSEFEPCDLATRVKELGVTQVCDFGPEEANARYFTGRTDGLYIRPMSNLLKARIGDSV